MNCDKCNGTLVETYVQESDDYGISNMPAIRCINCGKHWFPPAQPHEESRHVYLKDADIAPMLGKSKQRVNQIAHIALKKMRKALAGT